MVTVYVGFVAIGLQITYRLPNYNACNFFLLPKLSTTYVPNQITWPGCNEYAHHYEYAQQLITGTPIVMSTRTETSTATAIRPPTAKNLRNVTSRHEYTDRHAHDHLRVHQSFAPPRSRCTEAEHSTSVATNNWPWIPTSIRIGNVKATTKLITQTIKR